MHDCRGRLLRKTISYLKKTNNINFLERSPPSTPYWFRPSLERVTVFFYFLIILRDTILIQKF